MLPIVSLLALSAVWSLPAATMTGSISSVGNCTGQMAPGDVCSLTYSLTSGNFLMAGVADFDYTGADPLVRIAGTFTDTTGAGGLTPELEATGDFAPGTIIGYTYNHFHDIDFSCSNGMTSLSVLTSQASVGTSTGNQARGCPGVSHTQNALSFTAASTAPGRVFRLTAQAFFAPGAAGQQIHIPVTLAGENAIPEPGTWGLALVGTAALSRRKWLAARFCRRW